MRRGLLCLEEASGKKQNLGRVGGYSCSLGPRSHPPHQPLLGWPSPSLVPEAMTPGRFPGLDPQQNRAQPEPGEDQHPSLGTKDVKLRGLGQVTAAPAPLRAAMRVSSSGSVVIKDPRR